TCLFLSLTPRPPTSTLFPYTTLFRSLNERCRRHWDLQRGPVVHPERDSAGLVRGDRHDTLRLRVQVIRKSRPGWQQQWLLHVARSEEHTSELQSRFDLVCRLLLEKKN